MGMSTLHLWLKIPHAAIYTRWAEKRNLSFISKTY